MEESFPGKQLRPVSELFEKGLSVKSASGEELNFEGWISLEIRASLGSESVSVPFLITKMDLETPILGYNVIVDFKIEELLLIFKNKEHKDVQSVASVFANEQNGDMGQVKVGRSNLVIPAKCSKTIRAVVHAGVVDKKMQVLFVPEIQFQTDGILELHETLVTLQKGSCSTLNMVVHNLSNAPFTLQKNTILGHLVQVKAVITLKSTESWEHEGLDVGKSCKQVNLLQSNGSSEPEERQDAQVWDPEVHFSQRTQMMWGVLKGWN